jgi:hypothetical protein
VINLPGHAIVDQQSRLVAARLRLLRDERRRKVVVELVDPHPTATLQSPIVHETAIERAKDRVEQRADAAALDAVLERTRADLARLSETAAEAAAALPAQIAGAVESGLREQVLPVGRHLAEIRGLMNQVIRRLDGLERATEADRRWRVEDLGLLVDLIAAGWESVDERLARIEKMLGSANPSGGNGSGYPAAVADAA